MPAAIGNPGTPLQGRIYLMALCLLVSPFYLNDIANIYVRDWRWWLFIDYTGVKLFPLLVVLWVIRNKHLCAADLGLVRQPLPSWLATFLLVTLFGTLIDQNAYRLIDGLPGYTSLAPGIPEVKDPVWNWIDLTLGLAAVGLVEELVFRGYMYFFLMRHTQSTFAVVFISSIAFGLIHWSAGLQVVVVTTAIGALLMLAYMRTKSLPAIMLAHAAIDFIDFAGVVPKALFNFV